MVQFWPGSQITYLTEQTQRVVLDGEQGQVQSDSVTLTLDQFYSHYTCLP